MTDEARRFDGCTHVVYQETVRLQACQGAADKASRLGTAAAAAAAAEGARRQAAPMDAFPHTYYVSTYLVCERKVCEWRVPWLA